jgi:hypothetical protein
VSEWLKVSVLKTDVRRRTGGSNPPSSVVGVLRLVWCLSSTETQWSLSLLSFFEVSKRDLFSVEWVSWSVSLGSVETRNTLHLFDLYGVSTLILVERDSLYTRVWTLFTLDISTRSLVTLRGVYVFSVEYLSTRSRVEVLSRESVYVLSFLSMDEISGVYLLYVEYVSMPYVFYVYDGIGTLRSISLLGVL